MTSKATEELPKQDRKQQVQESARKQGGKKTSGLSVVHLSGYVKVSSANLQESDFTAYHCVCTYRIPPCI